MNGKLQLQIRAEQAAQAGFDCFYQMGGCEAVKAYDFLNDSGDEFYETWPDWDELSHMARCKFIQWYSQEWKRLKTNARAKEVAA